METKLFIDGELVDAQAGGTIDVKNPFDDSLLAKVAEAREADVDLAVAAAARAQPAWGRMAASDRGRLLMKLADAIEANAERLATLESRDTGHPLRDVTFLDVPRTAMCFRYFGGMADKLEGTVVPVDAGFLNYVTREPVGVVGQIVPWNFPLMFTSWKMGPALAAGNAVVLKSAELTPLSTLAIATLMRDVGFPKGVVNVVQGYGHVAGSHLARHPGVAKLAFTGSTATGRKIVEASATNLKKVQLELGGKGANVVFADADLDAAVGGAAFAIFHNQGQACIAGSRLILHESIAERFLERLVTLARSIKLGDPLDRTTEMGPLTSRAQQERVLEYVALAKADGAEILTGGKAPTDAALAKGYFVEPTLVRAAPSARVANEEVFGPFLVVHTFREVDEALAIANGTPYGLGAGLWTRDISRAHAFAAKLRAGMVWINCYKRVHPGSPFGGVGESGYGREMGFEAMREYTQTKSTWVNVDATIPPFYRR
jgi:aldehyde dehydrogenase (NAD+)